MKKIFISGSMQIKILDNNVKKRIDNIIEANMDVIVGDADGVDSSIQAYLLEKKYKLVTIFCTGNQPRNNIGRWDVKNIYTSHAEGTRAYFTAKDLEMASQADYGLMIWDTKSTGTLSNVFELLKNKKSSVVYINKIKKFINVVNVSDFENLISNMSETSFVKANEKLNLINKIESLKYEQLSLIN